MDLGKWLEKLVRHGRPLSLLMLVIMALLVIIDIIVPPAYVRFPWDALGGFPAVYGFISCVLLIAIAKGLGKLFLYQPEDYYNDETDDA
ncbi:MAG: hypothetical protein JJU31_15405 [Wenzhouxiangella sp.]|nr:hypothetical protein [Wenzhouxiangella sp.]MCH8479544.1 hypothetical protein [Wenzhouxiangella sp.]TVR94475.1 MAG: hypothetical protein EA418_10015 [Wenzhouxiangellaceae bacterium]